MPSLAGAIRRGRGLFGLPPLAPTILMYHRVAEPECDPWGLAVSPAWFERQMAALNRRRSPMSVDELVRRLELGSVPRNAVAVTFDDGYLDNLTNAKPVLEKYHIPATLFVTTGSIGQPTEFWWDELARLTIGRHEASRGSVAIGGNAVDWQLPEAACPGGAAARRDLHQQLWTLLRGATAETVDDAMHQLRAAFDREPGGELDRPMNEAEIGGWLEGGLTEIAGHSISHRPLTSLSPDELEREVAGSMLRCAEIAGHNVRGFAYPYGDRDAPVADSLGSLGVEWACSTRASAVREHGIDYFDLPRLQVRDGDLRLQWRTA